MLVQIFRISHTNSKKTFFLHPSNAVSHTTGYSLTSLIHEGGPQNPLKTEADLWSSSL